jgi:hypothetical protein
LHAKHRQYASGVANDKPLTPKGDNLLDHRAKPVVFLGESFAYNDDDVQPACIALYLHNSMLAALKER